MTNSNSATAATVTTSTSASTSCVPLGLFLVARRGAISWAASGCVRSRDPALHYAEVKRLWVRPDLRRDGVGLHADAEIERHARERGCVTLFLETGPAQPEALALYSARVDRGRALPDGAFSHPSGPPVPKDL